MQSALTVLAAYCLGSVSFAIAVSRLMQLPDPRTYGSRNPGATNVLRTGRRAAAALTLAGDAGKGWLAVWLAQLYAPEAAALAGLAVFLGHLFPLFHRFKGGKGVATAAGMFLALAPLAVLIAIVVWVICLWLTGYVSLSSIIAVLSVPLSIALLQPHSPYVFWASVALVALIIFAHRRNIRRLLDGTENRFRTRPSGRQAVGPPE